MKQYVLHSEYEDVAATYTEALLRGDAPVRAVESELGLSRKAAEYRVRTARAMGLLPPTRSGIAVADGRGYPNPQAAIAVIAARLGLTEEIVRGWPPLVIRALREALA